MKIIIPMAGLGSRFSAEGYTEPKPLIQFLGKPMIQHVVEHTGLQQFQHIFICQKQHVVDYNLHELFATFIDDFKIVEVDGLTEGAAMSVLLADTYVEKEEPALIVNCDQLTQWDKDVESLEKLPINGCIFCFAGTGNKWSYAKLDAEGFVEQVAEKQQISEHATSGMYYWRRWGYFVDAVKAMVLANDRVNGEFYVAPTYNHASLKATIIRYVDSVDQVGTPEELEAYIAKAQ